MPRSDSASTMAAPGVEVVDEAGDRAAIVAYFENEPPPEERPRRVTFEEALRESAISPLGIEADAIADRDWNTEWRRFYKEVWPSPNMVVHPPWIEVETSPGDIAISIEPAMAFGTGTHESTRLCLEALAATELRGRRCLDVGTGTGILAIAAAKLGAKEVVAVDVDSDAVRCARENVEANLGSDPDGPRGRVRVLHGSVEAAGDGPFAVIAANLESRFQLPILPALRRGGRLRRKDPVFRPVGRRGGSIRIPVARGRPGRRSSLGPERLARHFRPPGVTPQGGEMPSFFAHPEDIAGDWLILRGDEAHHVAVRRYSTGDLVEAIGRTGGILPRARRYDRAHLGAWTYYGERAREGRKSGAASSGRRRDEG